MRRLQCAIVTTAFALSALPSSRDQTVADDVNPFDPALAILTERCLECHSDAREGGLDLRQRSTSVRGGESGAAIVPGRAAESLIYRRVADGEMPPNAPLPPADVALIEDWINRGAAYPDSPLNRFAQTTDRRAGFDWWSLQPLRDVAPPTTEGAPAAWSGNPIDRFVIARLAEHDLQPSAAASPRTLIRRAAYDLLGLPPAPQRVDEFLQDCRHETGEDHRVGEQAYTALVDELLDSPRYGEQWGRHWLDVVRFGESNGYERNVIHRNVWPFRDYVIESFNADKPFDQFIIEQLAGDVVAPGDPDVAVGATFLVCGPFDNVGNQDAAAAAQIRADAVDEMIRVTSEAFLGLTVGCSRCHDHKFDPISQRDYYRLYATFAGVRHHAPALEGKPDGDDEPPRPWVGSFHQADGPFHVFTGGSPQRLGVEVAPASIATLEGTTRGYRLAANSPENVRRYALAQWLVATDNPLTPRVIANRIWHYHFGAGLAPTPSDFGFLGEQPSHPDLLDWLARELQEHQWRVKPLHRQIMLSRVYRQNSRHRVEAARVDRESRLLWRFPPRRLSAEEIRDSMLAITGNLDLRMGGPGFRLFQYVQDNVATYHPLDEHGPETYRRAVYHHTARATQIDLISDFDAPDCAFPAPRRLQTTTPTQALAMLNHRFSIDMAEALARSMDIAGDNFPAAAARAFQLALTRPPTRDELEAAEQLVAAHGSRAFCRALLNSNEFIYLD